MATNETAAPRQLHPVLQFAERYPAFSPASLRDLIFKSSDRINSRGERIPGNGLEASGAIVRIGRRVLIDEQGFFRWIADQQKQRRGAKAAA
jgi:hypothetical protein